VSFFKLALSDLCSLHRNAERLRDCLPASIFVCIKVAPLIGGAIGSERAEVFQDRGERRWPDDVCDLGVQTFNDFLGRAGVIGDAEPL
jgi:hypothetical protein